MSLLLLFALVNVGKFEAQLSTLWSDSTVNSSQWTSLSSRTVSSGSTYCELSSSSCTGISPRSGYPTGEIYQDTSASFATNLQLSFFVNTQLLDFGEFFRVDYYCGTSCSTSYSALANYSYASTGSRNTLFLPQSCNYKSCVRIRFVTTANSVLDYVYVSNVVLRYSPTSCSSTTSTMWSDTLWTSSILNWNYPTRTPLTFGRSSNYCASGTCLEIQGGGSASRTLPSGYTYRTVYVVYKLGSGYDADDRFEISYACGESSIYTTVARVYGSQLTSGTTCSEGYRISCTCSQPATIRFRNFASLSSEHVYIDNVYAYSGASYSTFTCSSRSCASIATTIWNDPMVSSTNWISSSSSIASFGISSSYCYLSGTCLRLSGGSSSYVSRTIPAGYNYRTVYIKYEFVSGYDTSDYFSISYACGTSTSYTNLALVYGSSLTYGTLCSEAYRIPCSCSQAATIRLRNHASLSSEYVYIDDVIVYSGSTSTSYSAFTCSARGSIATTTTSCSSTTSTIWSDSMTSSSNWVVGSSSYAYWGSSSYCYLSGSCLRLSGGSSSAYVTRTVPGGYLYRTLFLRYEFSSGFDSSDRFVISYSCGSSSYFSTLASVYGSSLSSGVSCGDQFRLSCSCGSSVTIKFQNSASLSSEYVYIDDVRVYSGSLYSTSVCSARNSIATINPVVTSTASSIAIIFFVIIGVVVVIIIASIICCVRACAQPTRVISSASPPVQPKPVQSPKTQMYHKPVAQYQQPQQAPQQRYQQPQQYQQPQYPVKYQQQQPPLQYQPQRQLAQPVPSMSGQLPSMSRQLPSMQQPYQQPQQPQQPQVMYQQPVQSHAPQSQDQNNLGANAPMGQPGLMSNGSAPYLPDDDDNNNDQLVEDAPPAYMSVAQGSSGEGNITSY